MTPRVSVILPVHNGMPFLEQSIESIRGQSFQDFELIIGDNGSTDGTSELVQAHAAADSRLRYLRRERKSGVAASADWLVREASAPLVAVAHADDRSEPERLHWQVRAFDEDDRIQLVGTLCEWIDSSGSVVRGVEPWRLARRSVFAPFPHSSVMFRKQTFLDVGGYRPEAEYWEDLDLFLRMAAVGRVCAIAQSLVQVRHSEVSARTRDRTEKVENAVDAMYRSIHLYGRGEDYWPAISDRQVLKDRHKLDPRTFVACGWTALWDGRRPQTMGRLLKRANVGLDLESLLAVAWTVWATVSPRTLRAFTKALGRGRNLMSGKALDPRVTYTWTPQPTRKWRRRVDIDARPPLLGPNESH